VPSASPHLDLESSDVEPEIYNRDDETVPLASPPDEERLRLLRDLRTAAYMAVPLRGREQVVGAITFVNAGSGRRFSTIDLAIAEDLARRAASAIESARLYHAAQAATTAKDSVVALLTQALQRSVAPFEAATELLRGLANEPTKAGDADGVVERCCDHLRQLAQDLGGCTRDREHKIRMRPRAVSLERLLGVEVEDS
jgi:GAF domain-containing protein